jgi:YVTN family beta-propeller protein
VTTLIRSSATALCAALCLALLGAPARALPMRVEYGNLPGEGFFDSLHGGERRAALEHAVDRWAGTLAGTVPVVVAAVMLPLGGSGADALLASAGAVTVHRNFNRLQPATWYGAALANQLAGADLNGGDLAEISIIFNGDVDGPEVLGSIGWYYGLDAQPGADVDFVTIALHEIGHGLNFFESVDAAAGGWRLGDDPGIFDRMLFRPEVATLADMRPAERLAAIVAGGELLWDGAQVVGFNGRPLAVYAPEPFVPGASIGHWDINPSNPELMEPAYTGAIHDLGALVPALLDMGWQLAVPTPTPRAPLATPTPTRSPRPTARPRSPAAERQLVYVSNFDDGTVSVIDAATRQVTATVAVGAGPIGVAAAPGGARLYVANFLDGSVSLLSTRRNRLLATLPVGDSANGIAVTPDGAFAVVSDTFSGRAAIVATDRFEVVAQVPAGMQPSGLALDPSGEIVFVTDFGSQTITVVDVGARLRRAIIPPNVNGQRPLALAIAAATGRGYVAQFQSRSLTIIEADSLRLGLNFFPLTPGHRPEAVVMTAAGDLAYVASHDEATGAGHVTIVDGRADERITAIRVGLVPEALALAADEERLYVANTGGDSVSVVNTVQRRAIATIAVGRAPMGVAIAAVPAGPPCDGDCDDDAVVRVSELVTAVAIGLDRAPVLACDAADADGGGTVTVDELIRAVRGALDGCLG